MIHVHVNGGEHCRGSSTEEQVTHGSHKGEGSQEPEVTDEITSQQSVKYGEKVEMRCGQWHYWSPGRLLV